MRTPWNFDNYDFPVNPDDDSGWTTEPLLSEKNAIAATKSRFQFNGLKSSRRQTQGYFFGPSALTQRSTFETWLRSRTQANLTDHLGVTRKAMLVHFEAKPVQDVHAYQLGRATFRFTAEWVALD